MNTLTQLLANGSNWPDLPSYVYRLFGSDGAVLYVGMTEKPKERLYRHRSTSAWWPEVDRFEFSELMSRDEAERREAEAIADLAPKYNRTWNHRRGWVNGGGYAAQQDEFRELAA